MEAMIFPAVLLSAAFLCSLVAGFLVAFAVVVMPGIGRLNNREFIRAFQLIDRVIQNGQPIFLLVWVGSALAVLATAGLGFWTLAGVDRLLVISAALLYLLCVQVSTVTTNIPLNNALQRLNLDSIDDATVARARSDFEPRWNRWNALRTAGASVASFIFLLLLLTI